MDSKLYYKFNLIIYDGVKKTFTLTFGDYAENHKGMEKIGKVRKRM